MSDTLEDSKKPSQVKIIRDKAFARRLEEAFEKHPRCPTNGRGKQKWLYVSLEERFGIKVSPEAARKWFAGESRPRPKVMSQIAEILDVDEAWLSLGITPDETPVERKRRNAVADGAVNYVAGLVQMSGGHIAFPDTATSDKGQPDIFAIINGRRIEIDVKMAVMDDLQAKVRVPADLHDRILMLVVDRGNPLSFDLLHMDQKIVAKFGKSRGGFSELTITRTGSDFYAGTNPKSPIRKITDFKTVYQVLGSDAERA